MVSDCSFDRVKIPGQQNQFFALPADWSVMARVQSGLWKRNFSAHWYKYFLHSTCPSQFNEVFLYFNSQWLLWSFEFHILCMKNLWIILYIFINIWSSQPKQTTKLAVLSFWSEWCIWYKYFQYPSEQHLGAFPFCHHSVSRQCTYSVKPLVRYPLLIFN